MRAGTPAWPGTTLEHPAALERFWLRVFFPLCFPFPALVFLEWIGWWEIVPQA